MKARAFFKFLGQALGFCLGVGLVMEDWPGNPLSIARDIGKCFDEGDSSLKKNLIGLGMGILSKGTPIEKVFGVIMSATGLIKNTKTIEKVFKDPDVVRFITPRVRSLVSAPELKAQVRQPHLRPQIDPNRGIKSRILGSKIARPGPRVSRK